MVLGTHRPPQWSHLLKISPTTLAAMAPPSPLWPQASLYPELQASRGNPYTARSWLPSRNLHLTVSKAGSPSPPVHSGLVGDITATQELSLTSPTVLTAKFPLSTTVLNLLNYTLGLFPSSISLNHLSHRSPQESPSSSPTFQRPPRMTDLDTSVILLLNNPSVSPYHQIPKCQAGCMRFTLRTCVNANS